MTATKSQLITLLFLILLVMFAGRSEAMIAIDEDCTDCTPTTTYTLPIGRVDPNSYSSPYWSPYGNPWYTPYGGYRYTNFYYPGAVNNGQFNSRPYPYYDVYRPYYRGPYPVATPHTGLNPHTPCTGMGCVEHIDGGGMVAMKPNVYIEAPDGMELELDLKLEADSMLLVSAPPMSKTLKIKIVKNKLVVNGARYSYLYYDFWLSGDKFQSETGFCTDRGELLKKMAEILSKRKFKESEIKDFYQHWSVKIPIAKSYCVFPQAKNEIEVYSKLSSNKKIDQVRQYFVVVPTNKKKGRFHQNPKKNWQIPEISKQVGQIKLREWAVIFLAPR